MGGGRTAGEIDVAAALVKLRNKPGALSRWENVAALPALLTIPDLAGDQPVGAAPSALARAAVARIKADIELLANLEQRRVAKMMLCVGRSYWADPALGIGSRRKLYVGDAAVEASNVDTLRTRREPEVCKALTALLLERRIPDAGEGDPAIWMRDSGLTLVSTDFYRAVPWQSLLSSASEVDLFFTYARTWRRSLGSQLARLSAHGLTVRVILPDIFHPHDSSVAEIARRCGQTSKDLRRNVAEALRFYRDIDAEVRLYDGVQSHSLYRFDDLIVAAMYNHQRGQTDGVPTFVCRSGGTLYDFFQRDFSAMFDDDNHLTRQFDDLMLQSIDHG